MKKFKKYTYFFEIFSFFQNVQIIVNSKKVIIMYDIEYLQNVIFEKLSDLKYFKNDFFFNFLIEYSMLTKNALDVYFPS